MRLFLKRDTADQSSRFLVYDELMKDKYSICGKSKPSGDNLKIIDLDGNTVAAIRQINLPIILMYNITAKGEKITLVYSGRSFSFRGISWHLRGDLDAKSFDIVDTDGTLIMSHCTRWGEQGDGYELNIESDSRELLALGVAVCINHMQTVDIKAPQAI